MPRPEKTAEIDRVLEGIIKHDMRRRKRGRRVVSDELIEAMDYYVRWGLASNRGRALIELAKPMANEVVQRVREAGLKSVQELVNGEPPAAAEKPPAVRARRRRAAGGVE
jgi:hypothetical protein